MCVRSPSLTLFPLPLPSSLFLSLYLCVFCSMSPPLPPPTPQPLSHSFSTDSRYDAVRKQVLKSIEKERKLRKLNKVRFRPGTTEYVPFSGYETACFDWSTPLRPPFVRLLLFQLQNRSSIPSSVHTLTCTFFSCSPFLYAIAGRSTKYELTLLHKYDPTLDKWTPGI
jgi:hypothetical protein